MGMIFKLIAVLTTLATTVLLVFESARGGMLLVWTVLGVVKVIVWVVFCGLLVWVLYLLLTSKPEPPPAE
jgi:hypothetical protein